MKYLHIPLPQVLKITDLISLNYVKFSRNLLFEGEEHDFWELIYVDQGQLLITAESKEYLLKAGELAFHKPGEFHAVRTINKAPANGIVAAFVCHDPCMRYFEHRFTHLNTQDREYLFEAFRHRDSMFKSPSDDVFFGGAQIVRANLELLLIQLIRKSNSTQIQERVESYNKIIHIQRTVEQVNAYLESHLTEQLTLKDIATDLGYSVSQLKRLYSSKTGSGVIDAFIGLKMDEARRLIGDGEMNISQIASALGYNDPAYFTRLFKMRFNITPSECSRSFK